MYPNKNSNNQKIESARGTMGGGKNLASSLSPSHCPPRAFFFLSPASLRYKEASAEARENELFLRM